MSSLSFDRAADYYDATRGYPPGVGDRIARAIAQAVGATPATRFIELGIGTGRIALPLILRGYDFTGVDLSPAMMARLRDKLAEYQREHPGTPPPRVDLREGDVTRLPFGDDEFDAAVTVHVLHLIPNWQDAVSEALRVVKPGGWYVNGGDEHARNPAQVNVQERWVVIARQMGTDTWVKPAGASGPVTRALLCDELRGRGLTPEVLSTVTWTTRTTVRQEIDFIARRLWSRTWLLPGDALDESVRQLESEVLPLVGGSDQTVLTHDQQFIITRTRVG